MNKPIILITDTLFINKKQESQLRQAGYGIERLPLLKATEAELKKAIKGKTGYILGGIEQVTQPVIDMADNLRGIVFTGIDYKAFIPAWQVAQKKGIALDSAPDGPTQPTAEWAVASALLMNRRLLETGRGGKLSGVTTSGLQGQKIGIIGFGRIGRTIFEMVKPFKPLSINYYSHQNTGENQEKDGTSYLPLEKLLKESDIVFLCIPATGNMNFLSKKEFEIMKKDALLVSIAMPGVVDGEKLYPFVKSKQIRVASSHALGEKFNDLPISDYYFSDGFASNTFAGIEKTSEIAVQKMLSILMDRKILSKMTENTKA